MNKMLFRVLEDQYIRSMKNALDSIYLSEGEVVISANKFTHEDEGYYTTTEGQLVKIAPEHLERVPGYDKKAIQLALKRSDFNYIVMFGAAMVLRDVKEYTNDIDVTVTCEAGRKFYHRLANEVSIGEPVEDYPFDYGLKCEDSLVLQISELDGVLVQTLGDIARHKAKWGREKDLEDIKLIESILELEVIAKS